MIIRLGRIVATVVAIVVGLFVLADLFASQWQGEIFGITGLKQTINGVGFFLVSWTAIVIAFALFLGLVNVVSVHWNRVRTHKPGSIYSVVLLIALVGTLIMGYNGPNS